MTFKHAKELRALIEKCSKILPDEEALEGVELFPVWNSDGVEYAVNDRVQHEGILYKCLIAHESRSDWAPDVAVSLWARVLIPDPDVIPDWEQPDSTNPYMKGDRVRHNGHIWESDYDYNVYEPGVVGWTMIE